MNTKFMLYNRETAMFNEIPAIDAYMIIARGGFNVKKGYRRPPRRVEIFKTLTDLKSRYPDKIIELPNYLKEIMATR